MMQPGNIRNYYFEKYLHSMALNLTVNVRNVIPFFNKHKLGEIPIFETFLAIFFKFYPLFHCESAIWAKSAIMTLL